MVVNAQATLTPFGPSGNFTVPSQRTTISVFVKQADFAYFKVELDDQGEPLAPEKVC